MAVDKQAFRAQSAYLVGECQAGEAWAFEGLYRLWSPAIRRHAWRHVADQGAIDEITQEAWLAIAKSLDRLDDPARFGPWALRIASNKANDYLRKYYREPVCGAANVEAGNHSAQASDNINILVRQVMNQAPREVRLILSLYYVEGMTMAEVAGVLDIPLGTVKSRLSRARDEIRAKLELSETEGDCDE